ncbi:MAG: alkaline phosphatase family protein [Coriobacteriia bacterium]|nr:alkaline phosphatase family protein [Coriobacteriia bacterium]
MAVILLILDGCADRPWDVLDGRTPLQAARTPNLDRFAAGAATGLLHPLGRGMAPGSELAHYTLFGFPRDLYPGRAVFEALGEGLALTGYEVVFRGLFSTVRREEDGSLRVLERRTDVDDDACRELTEAISPFEYEGIRIEFVYNSDHQGIVIVRGGGAGTHPSPDVTDSDPYVAGRCAIRPEALRDAREPHAARDTAVALEAWLTHVHRVLDAHPVNAARRERGQSPANFLLVKWSARYAPLPTFTEISGLVGASVSSGVTYKGISAALGMRWYGIDYLPDWTDDLRARIALARRAVDDDCDFVHIHTKAPDVAGHTKDPATKRDVLEALDAALPALWDEGLVSPDNLVIVTGDHGTPSGTALVHSGDAVPIAMAGAGTQADGIAAFDELSCAAGSLGHLEGRDLMPEVLNRIARIKYMSAKLTPAGGVFWPDETTPLIVE